MAAVALQSCIFERQRKQHTWAQKNTRDHIIWDRHKNLLQHVCENSSQTWKFFEDPFAFKQHSNQLWQSHNLSNSFLSCWHGKASEVSTWSLCWCAWSLQSLQWALWEIRVQGSCQDTLFQGEGHLENSSWWLVVRIRLPLWPVHLLVCHPQQWSVVIKEGEVCTPQAPSREGKIELHQAAWRWLGRCYGWADSHWGSTVQGAEKRQCQIQQMC